ncbi:uncharacterized protein LOC135218138 [Macrobrachium nipponense]|uniref:uncharacterized protein LOC135218138 n=1 Tax=Macrobrachium nipponense TaxID=159736 RepID=UPI0030C7BF14
MDAVAEDRLDLFSSPARIIVAGYSGSGKTLLVTEVVKKYVDRFTKVIISGALKHPVQNEEEVWRKLSAFPDIGDPFTEMDDDGEGDGKQTLFILDDVFIEAFERRKIIAPIPKVIISCDLTDMGKLARYNDGYKYIAVFIDVFSRYVKAVPLKKKSAEILLPVVEQIMESAEFNGESRLFVDRRGEFYNKSVIEYCRRQRIKMYSVSSYEIKASIAERVIQTIEKNL